MTVERVDHVHVEVSDRDTAALWYGDVLGLRRDPALAVWAEHPSGPLILCAGDGRPALALFRRDPAAPSRDSTVAFRIDGEGFRAFLERLPALGLVSRSGEPVSAAEVVDHGLARSLYFVDPDANPIEVTTYDV